MARSLPLLPLLAGLLLTCGLPAAHAQRNVSGAVQVFRITECDLCTADDDSIFCTEAKSDANYVSNGTVRVTIAQKKAEFGAAAGARFCWEGTFGKLLRNQGNVTDILGSSFVQVDVDCSQRNLYFRQCVIAAELAIILMVVGSLVFVGATTCILFMCNCCRCCNNKGDESKWGLCNRFCPWMPCSDPPKAPEKTPDWLTNPVTDDENHKSLFGRSEGSKMTLMELRKPALTSVPPATSPGIVVEPNDTLKVFRSGNAMDMMRRPSRTAIS